MAPQSMNGHRKGQLQNETPVKKIDALSFLSWLRDHNSAFESEKADVLTRMRRLRPWSSLLATITFFCRKSHLVKRVTARLLLKKLTICFDKDLRKLLP